MKDGCEVTLDETVRAPRKKFWQRSSRKRIKGDAISISSMNVFLDSTVTKTKKRRRITELASNFLFVNSASNKLINAGERSFGGPSDSSIAIVNQENVQDVGPVNKRLRMSSDRQFGDIAVRSWVTDIAEFSGNCLPRSTLSRNQVKRQEAIYELYCGENVLLGDLRALRDSYYRPLLPTNIFTPDELIILFGDLDCLIKVHSVLRDNLISLRDSTGFTDFIGPTLIKWLPTITEPYLERCRTQVWARHLLEDKRSRSKRFQEFLKKRMELPRAVDLWTYLDVPRSRVVKYPLLVNEIMRRTAASHHDGKYLEEVSKMLADLLGRIDRAMGDAECELARSKILVKSDNDPMGCIVAATELVTAGQLKDSRGLKLQCFLFDTCFALTRRTNKSRSRFYNLVYPVIPCEKAKIDESWGISVYGFKIANRLLTTNSEHERRHWIEAFKKAERKITGSIAGEKRVKWVRESENDRVI